jgi:hypothetical protein
MTIRALATPEIEEEKEERREAQSHPVDKSLE